MTISRRLVIAAEEFPVFRRLAVWLTNRRYRSWRKRHPDGNFGDFYAETISSKLARGGHHPTLGVRGWTSAGHEAPTDWDQESFSRRASDKWARVQALGLRPEMRCVDYGCGSLRLGQHAIRYLDADNYFGLDVTDKFFSLGLTLIDTQTLAEKRPRFAVISKESLAEVSAWRPHFIFSWAVVQHVPPDDIGLYFSRIGSIMAEGSNAFIIFVSGEQVEQFGAMNWRYPQTMLAQLASAAVPGAVVSFEPFNSAEEDRRGRGRTLMRLRR